MNARALTPLPWALAAAILATAARAEPPPCPFPGQQPRLEVQLYFGQSIRGTGLISHRAWTAFVADTITAALPDGFTVLDAYGQYRDPATQTIGREPTELVIAVAPDTDEFRSRVAAVIDGYKRRFLQRSVGIVTLPVCAAF